MLGFHRLLDRIFGQRVSFSIFVRIWLAFALTTLLSLGLTYYYIQKTVKPSAKRVVEDSLSDTALLLADLVASDVANLPADRLHTALASRLANSFGIHKRVWYDQKQHSSYHLYITDAKGHVLYDSLGVSVSADFSKWNDVYLTLRGRYGARSTDVDGHSVMYVASPVIYQGRLVGVLSVGKSTLTLAPYLDKSARELRTITLSVTALMLVMATLMAWWLRASVQSVNHYTKGLARTRPPYFYLGRELNELTASIHTMKDTIENKAYVTEYVHTLTHELKSPITAIRASSEILNDDLDVAERQKFTSLIMSQADKLTLLIDKMLTLAKLEQPSFRLSRKQVDLDALIEHCLVQQSAMIKQLGKQVQVNKSALTIDADEFWLTQAVQNVIDNAILYADTQIVIEIKKDQQAIVITVKNDSAPLPDFVISRAFERYFSMDTSAEKHPSHKSTGLGLTLVKQVIQLHGGQASLAQYPADTTDSCWVVVCLSLPVS